MSFKQRIAHTIEERGIFQRGDLVLVALSGGADSVAMLRVLHDLDYRIEALHCNFHLREAESDRDELFVSQLCQRMEIPLHVKHFDTRAYANNNKVSVEMAARDLRYEWFEEQRQQLGAQAIAVAHHRDDQAETLLLNMVRGAGLRGLAGMKYRNGHVCRPLLDVCRNDILDYLQTLGQDYVNDSTNQQREAMRNRIRLDIIPALAALNPNISQTLSTLASNVQDALPIYERGLQVASPLGISNGEMLRQGGAAEQDHKSMGLLQSPFCIHEASLTLLYEWVNGCGFTRTQLQNILEAHVGRMVESQTHRLLHDREHFVLHEKGTEPKPSALQTETVARDKVGTMVKGNAYLDAALVKMPLTLRRVRPNDSFRPLGMRGSRLINNYLTDLKVNRFAKEFQEVLTDASGQILWVVGYATDNHFRITDSTKDVLVVKVE